MPVQDQPVIWAELRVGLSCCCKSFLRHIFPCVESRPIPGKDFEFRFYFDLDGSVFSPETMTVLKDIEQAAESLSFLGCYSEV